MKILSTLGKVGAVVGALGGLVLAGKSGFGKDLFTANEPSDQGEPTEVPTTGEFTAEATESPAETTVEEPASSGEQEG